MESEAGILGHARRSGKDYVSQEARRGLPPSPASTGCCCRSLADFSPKTKTGSFVSVSKG
ncbi:Hypothetical predicted protein, partial [Podarcis lilfordi]